MEVQASSPRRLCAFVKGLPPDSAFRRDGKQWTTEHELAARQVEATSGYLRIVAQVLGAKFKSPAEQPVRHPDRATGNPDAPKRMSTREEIAGFLGRLRR